MLDKNAILAAADLKSQDIDVPEWGGTVRVKTLSGIERERFLATVAATEPGTDPNQRMGILIRHLLVTTLVGEDGLRLFSDDDVDTLGTKSAEVLQRLFIVAQTLNGLGAKAQDNITKN